MIRDKKREEEPSVDEITLADIVDNEEDKKILEPIKVKPEPKTDKYIIGVADKDGVFIRKEANETASILYILKKGECVIINHDNDTNDYYYASIKSVIGYVLKKDITIG